MRPHSKSLIAIVLALSLAILGVASARAEDQLESSFRTQLQPILKTFCFDCHDSGSDISLAEDTSALALRKNRKLWISALNQVRSGVMPPPAEKPMDSDTRKRLVAAIDRIANSVNCVQNPNAGKVALRRLNRNEYRNTIRDLTGVDYEPAKSFPGDDVGYGFDNIGDVLSMPPILLEKYLDAAEIIMGRAIYTPPPPELFEVYRGASQLKGSEKFGGGSRLTMASHGTVTFEADLPFATTYKLVITASGDQAGDEPVKLEVKYGNEKKTVNIPSEKPKDYTLEFRLARGKRKIDLSFINDYYKAGVADRNLHLHAVSLIGSKRTVQLQQYDKLPASHRHIIFAKPNDSISEELATAKVVGRFASRAFRRPATNGEVKRLASLSAQVRKDGGTYEEGIQVALQAVLVSPHFLFKVEQPRKPDAQGRMPRISSYELATRISYFLWSSMPDDELLQMAQRGDLRDQSKLMRKVASMIKDKRSNRFVESFASQWLQLRNLDSADPDRRIYRTFNDEIRKLMRRETLTFFAGVMRDNLPVSTLLDANFTYLNEPLAKYYGIRNVQGDSFRKVLLTDTRRGGLLTQASVLTVTSNPTRTSPVKRGKWILDNLLNTPPPPAPANVPELEKGKLVGTLRERMEQHRKNPACAACHNLMDPLGFAMQNFDAVGLWRDREGGKPIDASGKLPDGTAFRGATELRKVLSTARREQFARCLAEKMLIYAIGRGTEYYDKCAVDKIVAGSRKFDHRFAYLIAGIIQSDPFQKQGFRE